MSSHPTLLERAVEFVPCKSGYSRPCCTSSIGHILQHIAVPQFDAENPIHAQMATLSQQAHQLAAAGDEASLATFEAQVDEAAAELWGITERELQEIRRSLGELG